MFILKQDIFLMIHSVCIMQDVIILSYKACKYFSENVHVGVKIGSPIYESI